MIPLEGSRWNSSIIHVHVYGGQDWQRNQTYEAMQIWNQAQFGSLGSTFRTVQSTRSKLDDGSAQVQVRLLNQSTVVGSIQGVDRLSRPEWYYGVGERTDCCEEFQGGRAPSQPSRTWPRSRNRPRLMLRKRFDESLPCDAIQPSPVPTTLDLYAVHVLASGDPVPNYVLLPNKIPYQTMPSSELALPEFPNLLLVLVSVPGLMLIRRRQLTK